MDWGLGHAVLILLVFVSLTSSEATRIITRGRSFQHDSHGRSGYYDYANDKSYGFGILKKDTLIDKDEFPSTAASNVTSNATTTLTRVCDEYGCPPASEPNWPPYNTPPPPRPTTTRPPTTQWPPWPPQTTPYPYPTTPYPYPTTQYPYPTPSTQYPYPTATPPPGQCYPAPAPTTYSTLPSITLTTNCDFCDHSIYTRTCIPTPFACAMLCASDWRCSHFTHVANINGGTCYLKSAPDSGGGWASSIPSPSAYTCGYIPKRSFTNILLSICLGLDIALGNTASK